MTGNSGTRDGMLVRSSVIVYESGETWPAASPNVLNGVTAIAVIVRVSLSAPESRPDGNGGDCHASASGASARRSPSRSRGEPDGEPPKKRSISVSPVKCG